MTQVQRSSQSPKSIYISGMAFSISPSRQVPRASPTEQDKAVSAPIEGLNAGIAKFYDASTGLWENVWGDHLHHGYYPAGSAPKSNRQAQVDMIEHILQWAGVTKVTHVRFALLDKHLCLHQ